MMGGIPNVYRTNLKVFTKRKLPEGLKTYRPKYPYRAARIDGPFEVEAGDGHRERCEDGYLVMDWVDDMFAADKDEFEADFEEAGHGTGVKQLTTGCR